MEDVRLRHAVLLADVLEARRRAVVAIADNHLVLDDKRSDLAALAIAVLAPYLSHAQVSAVKLTLFVWDNAVPLQESFDVGLLTSEVHIQLHGVGCATFGKDFAAKAFSCLLIEDTVFLEKAKSISIQHLSPLVAVVACRITTAHDVRELYAHVCVRNGRQQLRAAHSFALEVLDVVRKRFGKGVVGHVEHTETELSNASIATIEVAALTDALNEFVGQRRSCFVVKGKGMEELWFDGEVLHQLRGQFHEVAQDVCAAQALVMHLREDAVQGMTELVQESFHLAQSQ